ncbi:MAG TPA: hypothetical protein VJ417_09975, partial [Candidatus Glassbacteria bacterium]|nr:hypothetical protein [Candidatus Glassbacteria bacterium]
MDGPGRLILLKRFRLEAKVRTREIAYRRELSWEEYRRVRQGYIPRSGSDKWLVVQRRGELQFFRSGNGTFVYAVKFKHAGGGFVAERAVVNDDPGRLAPAPDHYERKLLDYLIDRLLLGHEIEFPAP